MRKRDSQRARLYKAERAAWACYNPSPPLTLEACKKLIQRAARYAHGPTPYVADGRGTRIARASQYRINLPRWARKTTIVLHEYAHIITPHPEPGHGRVFARNYIRLIRRFVGKTESDIMKLAFREYGVRFRKSQQQNAVR